jgi:hypothetical protein
VAFAFLPSARAQLPHARLDRLFPLGGAAGSGVVVEVSGRDLDDASTRLIDRPGVKVEKLKANQFRLTLPADATPGTAEVRVVGRYGISGSRLFAIQTGLTEVAEKGPNDTAATAQKVPLDCVINGTSDNEGEDHFRFAAKKGQRVVVDCQAIRLDSTLRAALTVSDSEGKVLARSRPYYLRTDPLLDVLIPADGEYTVELHDATYGGGLPYRLLITTKPHLENVFPRAVAPGSTSELTILGRNLGGKPTGGKVLDRDLDALALSYTAPANDASSLTRFDFLRHPTASTAMMRGWQFVPKSLAHALPPLTMVNPVGPITLEREDNDTREKAQPLKVPTTLCGRFDKPGDADWYRLDLDANEAVQIDLLCERLDLPGDPFVIVTDAKGNEVGQFDDHGISFNALALYNRDPFGVFRAPSKGAYYVLIQDRYRQGGPRYQYVAHITKPDPDFMPVAFHATVPHPTSLLVRAGGCDYLEVCLNRRNFSGPVVVEAHDLPAGVTCPPVHVSPQTDTACVVFVAADGAKEWAGPIRLTATATIDGKKLIRELRGVQRRWAIDNINTSRLNRQICLAVRPGAPYRVELPEKATGTAGGALDLRVSVRRFGDFKGKVQITGLDLPPGFGLATLDIPEGKAEGVAKLTIAGNVPPGSYSVVVRGDGQVPFTRDDKPKANVRVADPSTPVTVVVTAPAKK